MALQHDGGALWTNRFHHSLHTSIGAEGKAMRFAAAGVSAARKPLILGNMGLKHLRAALLCSAAVLALMIVPSPTVQAGPDDCVVSGTTATCQGDQSEGIVFLDTPLETINVNNLTGDIAPAPNIAGISLLSTGPSGAALESDTAPFAIITQGDTESVGVLGLSYNGVTINHTGDIAATGRDATGVYAVTIDGNVNVNLTGDISAEGPGSFAFGNYKAAGISAFSVNGKVSISHTGDITTDGFRNAGIRAFKHNYGGYHKHDLDVTIEQTGSITTFGPYSPAISATYRNNSVAVIQTGRIATAGEGSDGLRVIGSGPVTIQQTGDILTAGFDAEGISVRTGENLALTQTGDITTLSPNADAIEVGAHGSVTIAQTGDLTTHGAESDGVDVSASRRVQVTQTGNIQASGRGIRAVSQYGPVVINQTGDISTAGIFGREGIYADSTGPVRVTQTGNISTVNSYSHAIRGNSFDGALDIVQTGQISTLGSSSRGIDARSVYGPANVTQTGRIETRGMNSDAILVRNARSQPITIVQSGDVVASGEDSRGIVAEGDGGASVTVEAGSNVQGGISAGSAVRFSTYSSIAPAGQNTLTNRGTLWALSGLAVSGGLGNETIDNSGVTTGDVRLGGGSNILNNSPGGLVNSGAIIDLGASGRFRQDGILSPGGAGTIASTSITGNLTQGTAGKLSIDIDPQSSTSDRIDVTGTANLDGSVAPNLFSLPAGPQTYTIATAANTDLSSGLTVEDTLFVDYELQFPANAAVLSVAVANDPAIPGATPNQRSIISALAEIFSSPSASDEFDDLFLHLANSDAVSGLSVLEQLSGEHFDALVQTTFHSALGFNDALMSCRVVGGTRLANDEGECAWGKVSLRTVNQDATSRSSGFEETAFGFKGGYQFALGQMARLGVAAGYERASIDGDSGANSNGDRVQGGIVLKYLPSPFKIAGSVTGGYGWHDTDRQIALPGAAPLTASSDQDVGFVAGHLQLSMLLGNDDFYLKPQVDGGLTYLHMQGFSENGAGGFGLNVADYDETYATIQPSLEIGGHYELGNGEQLRPYIRGGVMHIFGDDSSHAMSLQGAPAGLGAFTTLGGVDKTYATLGFGLDLFSRSGSSFSVYYDGQLSFDGNTEQHTGGMKATLVF